MVGAGEQATVGVDEQAAPPMITSPGRVENGRDQMAVVGDVLQGEVGQAALRDQRVDSSSSSARGRRPTRPVMIRSV